MTNSIIAHQDFMKDRPEVLRRFLTGWYETVAYLRTHKEETVKAGMQTTGLSEAVVAAEYDQQKPMWSADGRITPEQLETLARAITEIGLVDEKPELSK
jgi:ABC-type nitrate/sulfonate/bicarbonate transport system substrate-binding protein